MLWWMFLSERQKHGEKHFCLFFKIMIVYRAKIKPTLCHIKALELDWLCVIDHGWEVRVDVCGGAYVGVLSYESLFRFLLLLPTLHRNGDTFKNSDSTLNYIFFLKLGFSVHNVVFSLVYLLVIVLVRCFWNIRGICCFRHFCDFVLGHLEAQTLKYRKYLNFQYFKSSIFNTWCVFIVPKSIPDISRT